MLVLTIRPRGCLFIGENIKIYNHQDFQMRIGIDAPKEIPILREEVKQRNEDMATVGQNSLSNFYESVKFSDPLKAALLSEDVVTVALNSLASDRSNGQEAAHRLRENALDLPESLRRVLTKALVELGYEI